MSTHNVFFEKQEMPIFVQVTWLNKWVFTIYMSVDKEIRFDVYNPTYADGRQRPRSF